MDHFQQPQEEIWRFNVFALLISLPPKVINSPFFPEFQSSLFCQGWLSALPAHGDRLLLCLEVFLLEGCPAFLNCSALQDCLPRDAVNHDPEQANVCPRAVQGNALVLLTLLLISPRTENFIYNFMTTAPKSASSHRITHSPLFTNRSSSTFPSWLPHQLGQEDFFHTLRTSMAISSLLCCIY